MTERPTPTTRQRRVSECATALALALPPARPGAPPLSRRRLDACAGAELRALARVSGIDADEIARALTFAA